MRACQMWIQTTEKDLQPQNIGLYFGWWYAQDQERWQQITSKMKLAVYEDVKWRSCINENPKQQTFSHARTHTTHTHTYTHRERIIW